MSAIAALDDTALMAALHQAAFERAWRVDEFESLLTRSGAQAFGTKDGFILMQNLGGDDEGEILTLAVAPSARRQGLARGLIAHAQAALGLAHIHLEVSQTNRAARALYESLGFYETGRRKAYYVQKDGGRVDALVMRGDFHK